MLAGLLPRGFAWPARDEQPSIQRDLLMAFAKEFELFNQFMCKLVSESDPCQSDELLGEWERVLGLPDPCLRRTEPAPNPFTVITQAQAGWSTGNYLYTAIATQDIVIDNNPTTIEGRRAAVCARIKAQGGQSASYIEGVFAALGFTITIPPRSVLDFGNQFGEYLYQNGGPGQMAVYPQGAICLRAYCSDGSGAQGSTVGNYIIACDEEALCVMERVKPAHIEPLYI